jgi:beta-lactamase superfamily II metal-dependent hydrolase
MPKLPYALVIALLVCVIFCAGCVDHSSPPPVKVTQTTTVPTIAGIHTNSTAPMMIYYFDVGQGDSELVVAPSGKTMLIDASTGSAGKTVVADLKKLGIQKLDLVVATHPHEDHIGGMNDVFTNFPIFEFADVGYPATTLVYKSMLNSIDVKNIRYMTPSAGEVINFDPDIMVSVLSPSKLKDPDINDMSIVLRLVYRNTSFLFMGDAEKAAEDQIMIDRVVVNSDVLKVGHHGSTSSSGKTFISMVSPSYSIISVGEGNSYNHPAPATVTALTAAGSKVYRTDRDGTVTVKSDGEKIIVTSEKNVV